MLAHLTMRAGRSLDVRIEPSTGRSRQDSEEGESSLVVDLVALRALLLPPIPCNAWRQVTGACNILAPICANLHETLCGDFDAVEQLLLDIEARHVDDLQAVLPIGLLEMSNEMEVVDRPGDSSPKERPRRKRRRPSTSTSPAPIVIPSTHPSTPTIIITLSLPQARETSCRVPLQDHSFGQLLTVPFHASFNKIYPPMVVDQPSLPRLDEWRWLNGHYEAILPTLDEQSRRGLFSKPLRNRRKSLRRPTTNSEPVAIQAA